MKRRPDGGASARTCGLARNSSSAYERPRRRDLATGGKTVGKGTCLLGAAALTGVLWLMFGATTGRWLAGHETAVALLVGAGLVGASLGSRSFSLIVVLGLVFVAVHLAAPWVSGTSSGLFIGGFLPFSDANDYYGCARALRAHGGFGDVGFCSRRPLFSALLAGGLALSGSRLRVVLVVLAVMGMGALLVLERQLRRLFGPLVGAATLGVLLLFYRRFIGTTLSEHAGLAWGALGLALLAHGADAADDRALAGGSSAFALGLSARAGAFFVLPALLLWAAIRPGSVRDRARRVGLMALGMLAALLVSPALTWRFGTPSGLFSNFWYCLYGLLSGGGWTRVLHDHPELLGMTELARAGHVRELAIGLLRHEPSTLLTGSLRAWSAYLTTPVAFAFVSSAALRVALCLASLAGVAVLWSRRASAVATLFLAMAGGVVVSVPFAPPWDSDQMRVYAATMPLSAVLAALGLSGVAMQRGAIALRTPGHEPQGLLTPRRAIDASALPSGVPQVFLLVLIPVMVSLLSLSVRSPRLTTAPAQGATPLAVRLDEGAWLQVVDNRREDPAPLALRQREFRDGLRLFRGDYPGFGGELASLSAPFTLMNGYAVGLDRPVWIVRAGEEAPRSGTQALCVSGARDPQSQHYGLYYEQSCPSTGVAAP